jgi:hypothetical protein
MKSDGRGGVTPRTMTIFPRFRRLAVAAALMGAPALLTNSCARVPESAGTRTRGKQLTVSLTVEREINPNYFYFVLINLTDEDSDPGPVPVVQGPPWGNGFAAPIRQSPSSALTVPFGQQGFVGYVLFASGQYQVYALRSDPNSGLLLNPVLGPTSFDLLSRPDIVSPVPAGGNAIEFQLDLARLPGYRRGNGPDNVAGTADDVIARYVQINLLATDNLPVGSVDPLARKTWDALGDGRVGSFNDPANGGNPGINTYVSIPLDQNLVTSEDERNLEPPDNDVRERLDRAVAEPDLNIVRWTVRLQNP